MTALSRSTTKGEFSVWWYDPEGTYYLEKEWCDAAEAVKTAHSLANRPAAMMGIIKRITIIDGGDYLCFDWKEGKVIFDGGKYS